MGAGNAGKAERIARVERVQELHGGERESLQRLKAFASNEESGWLSQTKMVLHWQSGALELLSRQEREVPQSKLLD